MAQQAGGIPSLELEPLFRSTFWSWEGFVEKVHKFAHRNEVLPFNDFALEEIRIFKTGYTKAQRQDRKLAAETNKGREKKNH